MAALLLLLNQAFAADSLPPEFFGMNILHAINKTPWPSTLIGTIRLWDSDDTSWKQVQTSRDVFNFDGLDRWLKLAAKHKVSVLYTFGRVPEWANNGLPQGVPPTDLNDWDNYVRNVVRHAHGRIAAYELWNEPNQPNFYRGDITTLKNMAERAYKIIKREQPNAIVTTPSPTWHETSPSQWFEQYFAAGGGQFADVIAFHGYIGSSPEALTRELEKIRAVAKKYGVQKPIWDTESSWGIDAKLSDPQLQSAFLARSYILHASQGVHRFYWYAWDGSDGGSTPPTESWGTLWDRNGVRLPGRTLDVVAAWLRKAQLPLICRTDSTVWSCRMNETQTVIWDSSSYHAHTVDPQFKRYIDLAGAVHTVPPDRNVSIGLAPILLETQ